MFNIPLLTVTVGFVSVVATMVTTLWHRRINGPEATSQIVTASSLILVQLQDRIAVLEMRVAQVENDNKRYYRLYGPLPPPGIEHTEHGDKH